MESKINSAKHLIVVLGMHRSGTSAITKSLELLGVRLGEDLYPPSEDNPKGFWEDKECVEINNLLLKHLHSAYDRLGVAWKEIPADLYVSELKSKAVGIIAHKLLENNGIWGFKDPRTCRLLSFWSQVFQEVDCHISFVIAVRNPTSVASSLAKRNGIRFAKSYFLWLQHVLPPLSFVKDARHVVVDYDALMANPYSQLVRISSRLGLDLPDRESNQVKEFENNFLESELRHTYFTSAELELDSHASALVHTTYKLLQRLALDQESVGDPNVENLIQELNAILEMMVPAFEHINFLEDEWISLNQVIAKRDEKIVVLNQAMAERDKEIVNLKLAMAQRDHRIASLVQQANRLPKNKRYSPSAKKFFEIGRWCWHRLPLSLEHKQEVKNLLFRRLSFILNGTNLYRNWESHQSTINSNSLTKEIFETRLGKDFSNEYVPLLKGQPSSKKPARLICFYLPQYHPIPENNAWWGEGFTEWTNVMPAKAQFLGHYQPHVPDELGYYNLLDINVQRRQIELAKLYGIEGFCFYFYWFGGKRLLEAPIENYLNDTSLDLPFCLCWANENWSRRWDGLDSEILIAQQHSPEDDLAFIEHVARYIRDPRYIRIEGKPLLLVYRPSLLPSAKDTVARWRNWCRDNGIGEIYLAYTQSFEAVDPAKYDFDAAIEFPPNNSSPPNVTDSVRPLSEDFKCTVYDWKIFVKRSENYKQAGYKLFRSVCPAWDNTARRKNRGTVFINSTPELYQRWLENAIHDTVKHSEKQDERLIFVNAWNEWAEGAHLEPDARYGYAYLQATRNALTGEKYVPDNYRKIVLVAHDAYPHGAQLLVLNIAKTLRQGFGFHVDLVCLGGGPLKEEYAKWAIVHDLAGEDARGPKAIALAKRLYESGVRTALVNTTVSGYFLETLSKQSFECIALIHELRGVLDQLNLHGQAASIATYANKVVFPAIEVATSFNQVAPIEAGKLVIRPQGLYKRRNNSIDRAVQSVRLRQKLGLHLDSQIVLGVGYADYRKGIDLFVEAGIELAQRAPMAYWVWIGHWEQTMQEKIEKRLAQVPNLKERFIFPGLQADTEVFYGGADTFALTSREDPFPSVVLEALDAKVPVVAFEGAGGFVGLLNEGCGKLVPKENAKAFADAVGALLNSSNEREILGQRGVELVDERFSFRHYLFDLLDLANIKLNRISVVVPNYNYEQYLPERLSSILNQNYPIFELIFLDDGSSDRSVDVAKNILTTAGVDYKIIVNDKNSGSVFRQWKKGAELATGDLLWIAEADDSCEKEFLTGVSAGFRTQDVVMSYCESQQMNGEGKILSFNYLEYVKDIDPIRWLSPYVKEGNEEIANALSVKNTIPNVSAVLFKKDVLKSVLNEDIEQVCSFKIAGDWLVYMLALERGKIAFSPVPHNKHRRHSRGLTISNINEYQLAEIRRMQEIVAERHPVPSEKEIAAKAYVEVQSRQLSATVE